MPDRPAPTISTSKCSVVIAPRRPVGLASLREAVMSLLHRDRPRALARIGTMVARKGLFEAEDGMLRCAWCRASEAYRRYHDREWGFPVTDDRRLFEKLCLEGFQAGLSWLTILNKREAFRHAFADFDAHRIA